MEIRLLRSFLTIANEGSITRAAQLLHVTQPALSRQLALLEDELGVELFSREKRALTLTSEGLLLKRRAEEIVQLVDITEAEMKSPEGDLEGSISFGVGELASNSIVLNEVQAFSRIHPHVAFSFLAGVADQVTERLDQGLLDFGILLEPVNKDRYSFMRLRHQERWVAVVTPDDPLARKGFAEKKDLAGRPLILPSRASVRNELAQWFGKSYRDLDARFSVNLGNTVTELLERQMGTAICVEGTSRAWDPSRFCSVPLKPALSSEAVLAWKRDVAQTAAVTAFLEHLEGNLATE
ncbi:MAG: LysR family transcriptional regulator [Eggerthellaceae bacterium]|nr:LysR family transcriptional regulator [Eggerthellaceae bacterium]